MVGINKRNIALALATLLAIDPVKSFNQISVARSNGYSKHKEANFLSTSTSVLKPTHVRRFDLASSSGSGDGDDWSEDIDNQSEDREQDKIDMNSLPRFQGLVKGTASAIDGPSPDSMFGGPQQQDGFFNPFKGAFQAGWSLRGAVRSLLRSFFNLPLTEEEERIYGNLRDRDPSLTERVFDADEVPPEVLVVGGKTTLGQALVRDLVLKGFKVRVLVKDLFSATLDMFPSSVTFAYGDIADPDSLLDAVEDIDKIIFCEDEQDDVTMARDIHYVGLKNLLNTFQDGRWMDYGPPLSSKVLLFRLSRDFSLWSMEKEEAAALVLNSATGSGSGDEDPLSFAGLGSERGNIPPEIAAEIARLEELSETLQMKSAKITSKLEKLTTSLMPESSTFSSKPSANKPSASSAAGAGAGAAGGGGFPDIDSYDEFNFEDQYADVANDVDAFSGWDSGIGASASSSASASSLRQSQNTERMLRLEVERLDTEVGRIEEEIVDIRRDVGRMQREKFSWYLTPKNKGANGHFNGLVYVGRRGRGNKGTDEESMVDGSTSGGSGRRFVISHQKIDLDLNSFSGVLVEMRGDGQKYDIVVRTSKYLSDNIEYRFPVQTTAFRWTPVRMPFSRLVPFKNGQQVPVTKETEFDRSDIKQFGFSYSLDENLKQTTATATATTTGSEAAATATATATDSDSLFRKFSLMVSHMKVYRTQAEPDIVYISSTDCMSNPNRAHPSMSVVHPDVITDAIAKIEQDPAIAILNKLKQTTTAAATATATATASEEVALLAPPTLPNANAGSGSGGEGEGESGVPFLKPPPGPGGVQLLYQPPVEASALNYITASATKQQIQQQQQQRRNKSFSLEDIKLLLTAADVYRPPKVPRTLGEVGEVSVRLLDQSPSSIKAEQERYEKKRKSLEWRQKMLASIETVEQQGGGDMGSEFSPFVSNTPLDNVLVSPYMGITWQIGTQMDRRSLKKMVGGDGPGLGPGSGLVEIRSKQAEQIEVAQSVVDYSMESKEGGGVSAAEVAASEDQQEVILGQSQSQGQGQKEPKGKSDLFESMPPKLDLGARAQERVVVDVVQPIVFVQDVEGLDHNKELIKKELKRQQKLEKIQRGGGIAGDAKRGTFPTSPSPVMVETQASAASPVPMPASPALNPPIAGEGGEGGLSSISYKGRKYRAPKPYPIERCLADPLPLDDSSDAASASVLSRPIVLDPQDPTVTLHPKPLYPITSRLLAAYWRARGEMLIRNSGMTYTIIRVAGTTDTFTGDLTSASTRGGASPVSAEQGIGNGGDLGSPVPLRAMVETVADTLLDPLACNMAFYLTKNRNIGGIAGGLVEDDDDEEEEEEEEESGGGGGGSKASAAEDVLVSLAQLSPNT